MEVVRQKNVETRIVFPIVDADGDFVTGASSLDSEIDVFADGSNPDGFADCTNEATEIGSTGIYYLTLTSTEMNNDYIVVQVKTGTAGAKTQVILIRTQVGDPLNNAVTDDGTAINVASGIVEAQVKSIDANAITATSIASDAITAAKVAADVTTEFQNGLATAAALDTIDNFLDTEVAAILADTNELQTDWADGGRLDLILDARASQTSVNTIDDFLDTEIAAIKAKTDNLPSDPADQSALETVIDAVDNFVDTEVAAIKGVTDKLDTAMELDGAVYRFTTNALEQAPSGGASAADIADAVWEEALADHSGTAGSTAEALDNVSGGSSPSVIADAVWDEARTGHTTDGTFGKYLDAQVSTVGSVAIQGKGTTKAQAKDIAEKVWEVALEENKTAKQVLLEKSEFDPTKDKVMVDIPSYEESFAKLMTQVEDLGSKDTGTGAILEAIANIKQTDYTESFSGVQTLIESVANQVAEITPSVTEFGNAVKEFQTKMGVATDEINTSLDKVENIKQGFTDLQTLVDEFKDKLEEQTDMDRRVAAMTGRVQDKSLADMVTKIEKIQSGLVDEMRKLEHKIIESKFTILDEVKKR